MSYIPQTRYLRRIQMQQETPTRLPNVASILTRINKKLPRNQSTISNGGLNSEGVNSGFQATTSTPTSVANHRRSFSGFGRLGRLFTPQRRNEETMIPDDDSWADTTKSASIDLSVTADRSLEESRLPLEYEKDSNEIPFLHISQLRALHDPEAETNTTEYRIPIRRKDQKTPHVKGMPRGFLSDGFYRGARLSPPTCTTNLADTMGGNGSDMDAPNSGGSNTNTHSLDNTPTGRKMTIRRNLKDIFGDAKNARESSPLADDGDWDEESDATITPPRRESKGKEPAHMSGEDEENDEDDEDGEGDWKTISDVSRTTRQHPSMGQQYAYMSDEDEDDWEAESNASRTTAYRHPSMFKRHAYVPDGAEDGGADRESTTNTSRTPTNSHPSMSGQHAYASGEGDEDNKANEDDETDWQTEYSHDHTPERQQSKGKHVSTESDDETSSAGDSDNSDLDESSGMPKILRTPSPEPFKKVSKFSKWFVNNSLARRGADIGPRSSHPLSSPLLREAAATQSHTPILNFLGRLPFEVPIQDEDVRQKSAIEAAPAVLHPQPPMATPSKLSSMKTEPPHGDFLGAMSFENLDSSYLDSSKNKSAIGPPPPFLPPAPPVRPPSRRGSTQTPGDINSNVPHKGHPVAALPIVDDDSAVKTMTMTQRIYRLRGIPGGAPTTSQKITPQGKERGAFAEIMSTIPKPGSGQFDDRSHQGDLKERSLMDDIPKIAPHLVPIGFEMSRRKAEGKLASQLSKPAVTKSTTPTTQPFLTPSSNGLDKNKRHSTTADTPSKVDNGSIPNVKLGENVQRHHQQLEAGSGSKGYGGQKSENKRLSGGRKPAWKK